jgi:hypothetical protein
VPAKRAVARLLLSENMIGTLAVAKAPAPGHRGDVAERVSFDCTARTH